MGLLKIKIWEVECVQRLNLCKDRCFFWSRVRF